MNRFVLLALVLLSLPACSIEDSQVAHEAETTLMGLSEVDLQSCIGSPDQHTTFGNTDILTYYAVSTSSDTYAVPLVGGFSFTNGGYCHATFQVIDGHVTQILYSGEKNATFAPDAYCAPIVRTCLAHLRQKAASPAPTSPAPTSSAPTTPAPTTPAPAAVNGQAGDADRKAPAPAG